MMTPVNWYLFKVTGCFTRANMYIRRYTEEFKRSDVQTEPEKNSAEKKTQPKTLGSHPRRTKKRKNLSCQRKLKKSSEVIKEEVPVNPCSRTKREAPVVPDSPQMLEFFGEVRQRELRDYYFRMKAAERKLCCQQPRPISKCPSQNIYCSGAQSMKEELTSRSRNQDCTRYRDLSRLCSTSVACPHTQH